MSDLQTTPIAVLCSDLHLRETTPRSRAESDWYEVMEAHLKALDQAAKELSVSIICAGDIFDRWNPSSRLVSFAIDNLPRMYAIPGQHDLEGHSLDRRYKGAYGALCKAGRIIDLPANEWRVLDFASDHRGVNLWVWAMPWGAYNLPTPIETKCDFKLGVLHQYRWSSPDNKYAMAEDSSKLESLFPGLDALIIGDNHIPWELPRILNHGGFIPQNADQREYIPHYGVLFADGHIERRPYKVPLAQWIDEWVPEAIDQTIADSLIQELTTLENTGDTFIDRLRLAIDLEPNASVRKKLEDVYQKVTNG